MKKIIWILVVFAGLSLIFFGVSRIDSSAREAEAFLDIVMNVDEDNIYDEETFPRVRNRRFGKPILFLKIGQTIKEKIVMKAEELGIEPNEYVLSVTISTYSELYDYEEMIDNFSNLNEEEKENYINELKAFLVENSEILREKLDEIKNEIYPLLNEIRENFKGRIRSIFRDLKATSDETEINNLKEELRQIKEEIEFELSKVEETFLVRLEEEKIAVEGLYGYFIHKNEDVIKDRLSLFEKRFPRIYKRVKDYIK